MYAAATLEVCFAETLLRGGQKSAPLVGGITPLPYSELVKRCLVGFSGSELRLANFTGIALKNLGGDASVTSVVPYNVPQAWSEAIHSHPDNVDGLIYVSRHLNNAEAIVLFERAAPKLSARNVGSLLTHPDIGTVLNKFNAGI